MKLLLVVCGPTGTGKTSLAIHLARSFHGEIISADSRQIYKYMNIGTGKATPEERKMAYHLFCKRPMKIPPEVLRYVIEEDMFNL